MSKYKIVSADSVDRQSWQNYVDEHEYGTIFHTPYMYDVYAATPHYVPFAMFATDENKNILAMISGYIQTVRPGLLSIISRRSVMMQSPIFSEHYALKALLQSYQKEMKYKAIYTEIRNHYNTSAVLNIYQSAGFDYEAHLDIIIDLTTDPDDLNKKLDSSRRKQINRGYKRGAVLHYAGSEDMAIVKECYGIVKSLYVDIGLPAPEWEAVKTAFNKSGEKAKAVCFALKVENRIIGTRIVLCYKHRIFDWYAASDKNYYSYYPNDILPWEVFKWGCENGYGEFGFGGAGKPDVPYGVRDYKLKFGGDLVEYGRHNWQHSRLLFNLASKGFSVLKRVKGGKC